MVANGPLAGRDLRWLMEHHGRELLGEAKAMAGRFPLLVKLLDAREKLSLQVHPPAKTAAQLGGDPKTEMWYIADATPDAELFVGLKTGVTREEFEEKVRKGTVADCFHRVHVTAGDAMFLPSGRVHAIGSGLVIFEIQQNSDTTYRVFDWNRVGLDGKPRPLHITESLASIDFDDFEPRLVSRLGRTQNHLEHRRLADDPLFTVEAITAKAPGSITVASRLGIVGVVEGKVAGGGGSRSIELAKGQFCLVPAAVEAELSLEPATTLLLVRA